MNPDNPPSKPVINGIPQWGRFSHPFDEANLLTIKKPYSFNIPLFLKRFQLREWQAFQLGNEEVFIMIALYNTKKAGLVQFIYYDIAAKKKIRYEKKVIPWKIKIPSSLFGTEALYEDRQMKISARHDITSQHLGIDVEINKFGNLPSVYGHFSGEHDTLSYEPIVAHLPFEERRGLYTHKCLMPMDGELEIGTERFMFENTSSNLIIDDHKGYYPYRTRYDWVTGKGYSKKGVLTGFNIARNPSVKLPQLYNENCLWHDGVASFLPPVSFERPNGVNGVWHIRDTEGKVHLDFYPEVNTSVHLNLLFIESRYEGPYGHFKGHICDKHDNVVNLNDFFGMGEDFYLRS